MSMSSLLRVWCIAVHELNVLYRDFRLLGSVLLTLIAVIPSVMTLTALHEEEYAKYIRQYSSLHEQLKQVQNLSLLNIHVVMPPPPLSFLNRGILDSVAMEFETSRLKPPQITSRSVEGSWLSYFFPSFDISLLVIILFSVIPFVFGYSAFSKEKESGTLKLVLANPVSRTVLILGKLLGLVLALLPSFTIVVLLTLINVLATEVIWDNMNAGEWWALLLFFVAAGFYLLIMLQLSVLLSLLTNTSSNSLLGLLVIWLMILIIVPTVSLALTEYWIPSSKTNELRAQEQELDIGLLQDYIGTLEESSQLSINIPKDILHSPGIKAFSISLGSNSLFLSREGRLVAHRLDPEVRQELLRNLPELVAKQHEIVLEKRSLYQGNIAHMMQQREIVAFGNFLSPPNMFRDVTAEVVGTGPQSIYRIYRLNLDSHARFLDQMMHTNQYSTPSFFTAGNSGEITSSIFNGGIDLLRIKPDRRMPVNPTLILQCGYAHLLTVCLFVLTFVTSIRYDPR